MSHELKEGAEVARVFFHNGDELSMGGKIVSLSIAEQPGQMGMVPWVLAIDVTGAKQLYNCALLEGVELK